MYYEIEVDGPEGTFLFGIEDLRPRQWSKTLLKVNGELVGYLDSIPSEPWPTKRQAVDNARYFAMNATFTPEYGWVYKE